jgi:hypothetical protein
MLLQQEISENISLRRKVIFCFFFTVSETSVHSLWPHCFWAYGKAVHHGRTCGGGNCSPLEGREAKKERERNGKSPSPIAPSRA